MIGYDVFDADLDTEFRDYFDVVTSIATFEHVKDFRRSVELCLASLKKSGILIFEIPLISNTNNNSKWYESSLEHIYYPTVSGIEYLLQQELGVSLVGFEARIVGFASNYIGVVARDSSRLAEIRRTLDAMTSQSLDGLSEEEKVLNLAYNALHRFEPTPEAILALPALFSRVPNPAIFTRMTHLWHTDVVKLVEMGSRASAQEEEIGTLRDELRAANEAEAKTTAQLLAISSSTTWRATAFVRAHLATHPHMARHVRRAAKLLWWGASGQLLSKLRARRASLRQVRAVASFVPAAPAAAEQPASAPAAETQDIEPWSEALPMVSVILSEAIPEATRDALLSQLTRTVPRYELLVIARGSDRLPTFDHPSLRCSMRPADVGDDADGDFALKRAFGKYVCFLKPADRLSDNHLSRAIEQLERSGAEYAVCRTSSPLAAPETDEFALPPIFRRSTLERLCASSNFGSHDTRRSSFAAALAATEFSSGG
jgi:hypothetical protein